MEQQRKHFFRDAGTVVTGICPNGQFGAYSEDESERGLRGYGHTRLAAIANLAAQAFKGEAEEFDQQAAQIDHMRDLRKHEVVR